MIAADKLRTAVALVAISLKPLGQSNAAYIIDLRERFPQALTSDGQDSDLWRMRALALEDELQEAKLEAQKLTLELRAKETPPSSIPSIQTKPKKRRSGQQRPGSNPPTSDKGGKGSFATLPTIFESLKVIGSQNHLKGLLAQDEDKDGQSSLRWSTCHQVISGYGKLFQHCLSPGHRFQSSEIRFTRLLDDALKLYSRFLDVLSTLSIPSSVGNSLVSQLFTLVIRPLLQSLVEQSRIVIQVMCEPSKGKKSPTVRDPRPWISEILQVTFSWLEMSTFYSQYMRNTVMCELLQKLEKLLHDLSIPKLIVQPLSRLDRMNRLAARQSLWYFSSLIQAWISSSATGSEEGDHGQEINLFFSRIVSRLLTDDRDVGFWLGDLEKEMLLALVEQFWISGKFIT